MLSKYTASRNDDVKCHVKILDCGWCCLRYQKQITGDGPESPPEYNIAIAVADFLKLGVTMTNHTIFEFFFDFLL